MKKPPSRALLLALLIGFAGVQIAAAPAQSQPAAAADAVQRITLKGEEARRSDVAAEAVRSLRLLHGGSVADFRSEIGSAPELAQLTDDQVTELLALARGLMPAADAFATAIDEVVISGDRATVTAPHSAGRSTVSMRRDGARWRLAPLPHKL